MTLQRRLSGMERDLAAIQAKLDALEAETDKISQDHPEVVSVRALLDIYENGLRYRNIHNKFNMLHNHP